MPVMDEFKEEREKLKEQSFKKRLSYFWTYYKWHVIGSITAVIAIISIIKGIVTRTDTVLYGVMLNSNPVSFENDALADSFTEYIGIDTKKYSVTLNSSLKITDTPEPFNVEAQQFITVYSAAKDLDICTMDTPLFQRYAYDKLFVSLETCLTDEQLSAFSDRLYYVDYSVIEEIDALFDKNLPTDNVVIPDPTKPEEMKQPIPVGIDVSDCPRFTESYNYEEGPVYLGIVISSERKDMAVKFIEYLFE